MSSVRITALALLLSGTSVVANPATEWRALEALDAGPKRKPASQEEAQLLARNHFLIQRRALIDFLKKYPADPRAAEARLKLAGIIATEGMMDRREDTVREALRMLSAVENSTSTPESLKADAGFRRASILMQMAPGGPERGYKSVVAAANDFVQAYPHDVRGPRLLVEAAGVSDADPALKKSLLLEARAATSEASLRNRIADDLSRLDIIGTPLALTMPNLLGNTMDVAAYRGKPLLLVFWSTEAPQSLLWLRDFRAAWEKLPRENFAVATVSLDSDRSAAKNRSANFDAPWAVGFEGGGWQGPTVRSLGINALPAVWIVDSEGVVRSTNAKSNWRAWLDRLSP